MFIDVGRIPPIGHPRIDDAHRALAEAVNSLFEQWRGGASAADIRAGFELFLRAVGRHFREEEEIAAAAGCPGVDRHAARHRALLEALTRQIHALTSTEEPAGQGDRRIDLFSLIDAMLYEHEILDDQEFWPILHRLGDGGPAVAGGTVIEWTAALTTGHAEMDRQHRTLAEMLNALAAAVAAGAGRDEVAALVGRVIELARCHFQWEERQMERAGLPDAGVHALLHAQLLADLEAILDLLGRGEAVTRAVVPGRLRIWFTDHVTHADGEVAAALLATGDAAAREAAAGPVPPGSRTGPEYSPPPRAFAG